MIASAFRSQGASNWLLVGVLLAGAALFGMGLREYVDTGGSLIPASLPDHALSLPGGEAPDREGPREAPRRLDAPAAFTLDESGTLSVTGNIVAGTARTLEAIIALKGDAIKRVSLHSPGGALDEALAMADALRRRGLATTVEDGAMCASSCPLILAGGVERTAGRSATIGLHQFYMAGSATNDPAQALADAQMTTARIVRHLDRMGVDPALWLHALDTPPDELYFLSPAQMTRYGLLTRARMASR